MRLIVLDQGIKVIGPGSLVVAVADPGVSLIIFA
jgi:hypothetical protein